MKVLIFVRSLDVGGTERQVGILARGLAERGHHVVLVELYGGGAIEASLFGSGVRIALVGKRQRWDLFGPLWRLHRLFCDERPDVIYSFLPMQNVLATIFQPRRDHTSLVFGARASGMQLAHYDRLSAWSYRAEAWLSNCADLIIANAESFRADATARRFRNRNISVIPNAIDTDVYHIDLDARARARQAWRINDDAFVIGMVARLDPMKDHRNFVLAAVEFLKHDRAARFVLVGDGPAEYRARLTAMADKLGLSENVIFAGQCSDVVGPFNAFDIATLPSAFGEGFPNVIGEAMACGVPVVATDVGDTREIVGGLGEVVLPGSPISLAEAWMRLRLRLVDNPELRLKARDRIVSRYSVVGMVEATEQALLDVVHRK